jgi:hypothetical protein
LKERFDFGGDGAAGVAEPFAELDDDEGEDDDGEDGAQDGID